MVPLSLIVNCSRLSFFLVQSLQLRMCALYISSSICKFFFRWVPLSLALLRSLRSVFINYYNYFTKKRASFLLFHFSTSHFLSLTCVNRYVQLYVCLTKTKKYNTHAIKYYYAFLVYEKQGRAGMINKELA